MTHKNTVINKHVQAEHLSTLIDPIDINVVQSTTDYALASFLDLDDKLRESKSLIDKYYIGSQTDKNLREQWTYFMSLVDIYKAMRGKIKKDYGAVTVSNAWLKYHEIQSHYNFIPTKLNRKYIAFFNAEFPGDALIEFIHFMSSMRKGVEFDWVASSLSPSDESEALGDRYGLYEAYRSKWLMEYPARDGNNGDMTNVANIMDFARRIGPDSDFGGVDLYSHDAGMDVTGGDSSNVEGFNQQEAINARLHLGCAVAGFLTMRLGATFIAKQYTFFKTFTWNLILIYASMFDKFYVSKPLTSRPSNGEIYLIGIGFKGIPVNIKKILMDRIENFNTKPFIPSDAIPSVSTQVGRLEQFARIVFSQTGQCIRENVKLFDLYRHQLYKLKSGLSELRNKQETEWLTTYPVGKMDPKDIPNTPHIKK